MAIVPFPTCKLHAHNYIPKIVGGGDPRPFWSTCLHSFGHICPDMKIYALLTLYRYSSIETVTSFHCQVDSMNRNYCSESLVWH